MVSQSIPELIKEIRDNPGRNPYVDESENPSGELSVAAIAWAKGHELACNKLLARYESIPEAPEESYE